MALTEEQLELLGDELVPIFQRLEREVINDIARRVAKTGRLTETAEIQAEALQRLGFSPAEIRLKVMRMLNADPDLQKEIAAQTLAYKKALQDQIDQTMDLIDEQAAKTWEEAGNLAFHNDLSVWQGEHLPVKGSAFDGLIKAMRASTKDLKNLTKTMAFHSATGENVSVKRAYTSAMNNALTKVASGAFSFDRACDDVVRDLARSGLRTVDYDSGRSMQIDTAARLQVQTASTQLAGQVTMQNCETTGQNYVEVSYHIGARNKGEGHRNHASWQGNVYCLEGSDGVYENLEQATGYPSDPTGLCGYNCRHTFYPFWPGLSAPAEKPPEPQPKTWNGVTYDYYDATQEQRRREREIRAMKREASAYEAAGSTEKAKEVRSALRQKSEEYREFSEAMDISAKPNRLRVVETGRSGVHGYAQLTWYDVDAKMPVTPNADTQRVVESVGKMITNDFPALDNYVRTVVFGDTNDGVDAEFEERNPAAFCFDMNGNTPGLTIALDSKMWSDVHRLEKVVIRETETGGHVHSTGVESILAHEYGHAIYASTALRRAGYNGYGTVTETQKSLYEQNRRRIAEYIRTAIDFDNTITGDRAEHSMEEYIAECFNDYYTGRKTQTARTVVEYFIKEMV